MCVTYCYRTIAAITVYFISVRCQVTPVISTEVVLLNISVIVNYFFNYCFYNTHNIFLQRVQAFCFGRYSISIIKSPENDICNFLHRCFTTSMSSLQSFLFFRTLYKLIYTLYHIVNYSSTKKKPQ